MSKQEEADVATIPSVHRIILRGALGAIADILKRMPGRQSDEVQKVIGIAERAMRETRSL